MPIKGFKSLTLKNETYNKIIEKAREANLKPSEYLSQLLTVEVTSQ